MVRDIEASEKEIFQLMQLLRSQTDPLISVSLLDRLEKDIKELLIGIRDLLKSKKKLF
jgi:hypothetical protein